MDQPITDVLIELRCRIAELKNISAEMEQRGCRITPAEMRCLGFLAEQIAVMEEAERELEEVK